MSETMKDAQDDDTATESSTPPPTYPIWHNAVAGGVAGLGARMITAPLDLIRIRRQLGVVTYPHESVWNSWKSIVQNEGGISALFRGNVAAIYLWAGYAAVQFAVYNRVKDDLAARAVITTSETSEAFNVWSSPTLNAFVAGATAGVCATVATYPFDVCRTTFAARGIEVEQQPQPSRRPVPFSSLVEPAYFDEAGVKQLNNEPSQAAGNHNMRRPPKTLIGFARRLYVQKGVRGFYAGCGPAMIQIIPYMGINFSIYDYLTRTGGDSNTSSSVALSGYAGSIAGAISKICIYPVDTVKRRLQAQAFFHIDSSQQHYKGMWDCIVSIARDEGLLSFYRGVTPSVLKTTISTGLSFALFRLTKNALEGTHDSV